MQNSPTTALFRSAIGPVNIEYYLPILTRFESLGRSRPSWNWAAGLYTLNWMVYRGLWRQAAMYLSALICVLATAAIVQLVAQPALPVQIFGVLMLVGLAVGIPGFLGNAWLYAEMRNRMTQAIAASKTMAEANLVLSQRASTRQGFIRQLVVNAVVIGLSAAGYWLLLVPEKVSVSDTQTLKAGTQGMSPAPPSALASAANTSSVAALAASATSATLPTALAATIAATASAPITAPLAAASPASASEVVTPPKTPAPVVNLAPQPMQPLVQPNMNAPAASSNPAPVAKVKSRTPPAESTKPPIKAPEMQVAAANTKARLANSDGVEAPRITYFVNIGLFSKEENASAAVAQLATAGMIGTTQRVDVGSKKLTRVRSGPYETKADATEVAVKIRLMNLEAKVFAQKHP